LKFDVPRHEIAIVIVDDSQALLRIYEEEFEAAGLKVVAKFSGGKEVLAFFASPHSAATHSIVLLDLEMPEMDVTETARQLKQLNPNQRIVLTTHQDLSEFHIDEKLFDGVIQKPFTIAEFLATIENLSSPIQVKGSRIFREPKEIESLLRNITIVSKERLCSVRSATTIQDGARMKEHISTYAQAVSKGLSVFMVTEITHDNFAFCKQLIMNRGVHLRHLPGVIPNLSVWDEKHMIEGLQLATDSSSDLQVLYSNLESEVKRGQHLFDSLWNSGYPSEKRIRELESLSNPTKLTVITGIDDLQKMRVGILRNAQASYDLCTTADHVSRLIILKVRSEYSEAIARGVHIRLIFNVSRGDVDSCGELLKMGVDVRHLGNSAGVFGLTEKEFTEVETARCFENNDDIRAIYSDSPDLVEQHRSIFNVLWNSAIPATGRIKELEEEIRSSHLKS